MSIRSNLNFFRSFHAVQRWRVLPDPTRKDVAVDALNKLEVENESETKSEFQKKSNAWSFLQNPCLGRTNKLFEGCREAMAEPMCSTHTHAFRTVVVKSWVCSTSASIRGYGGGVLAIDVVKADSRNTHTCGFGLGWRRGLVLCVLHTIGTGAKIPVMRRLLERAGLV